MAAVEGRSRSRGVVPNQWAAGLFLAPVALLIAATCAHQAPQLTVSSYGVPVVDRAEVYERLVRENPMKALVDLKKIIPGARIDVRYATSDNFMKRPLYPTATVFLRCPAAVALRAVQTELSQRGLGLKIFDAYRPYRVTVAMWEPIRNPDYVADPAKGSRHNRGAAVDLTLVDLKSGEELPMPTGYDDFTPRAAQSFIDLPEEQIRNRALLRDVMERHGFQALPSEWWHFDYTGWEKFELLDLPFSAIRNGVETCRAPHPAGFAGHAPRRGEGWRSSHTA
jgi:zinc D-Ala-D-Ala dipeptidase